MHQFFQNLIHQALADLLSQMLMHLAGWIAGVVLSYAATAIASADIHESLALASAAIGGGLTLFPHMCTCCVMVKGLPSAPWVMW